MVTIVLLVSRERYLARVLDRLENLDYNPYDTNLLCIVDGDNSLVSAVQNLVKPLSFNQTSVVKSTCPGSVVNLDVIERRRRIAHAHNQAKQLVQHSHGHVFSIEDDTLIPRTALKRLTQVAVSNRSAGCVYGVELGRWGTPYVGAWMANDIYDLQKLTSVENKAATSTDSEPVDSGGLYCTLIRADLYKEHTFSHQNGLGPDVNLGILLRQLGYQNYIVWDVHCTHLYRDMQQERELKATDPSEVLNMYKVNDKKWRSLK